MVSWRRGLAQLGVQARAPRAALASYRLGRTGQTRHHPRRGHVSTEARQDLLPSSAPFPQARYLFLVGSIPERYGGRSASIMRKAQLFKEHAGVDCEIVMTHFTGDLDRFTTMLRQRGALVPGVTLRSLQDHDGPRLVGGSNRLLNTRRRMHARLDRMIGDDRVFLSVEARNIDHLLLTYHNPNAQQLYVLHNPHIEPPFDDPTRIQRAFRPLVHRHRSVDAVVFLTDAQRADMESVVGAQHNFFVVPHSMTPTTMEVRTARDPQLVVMVARLEHQKRVEDAINVFALVVRHHPRARLEIYGEGPEREQLQRHIERLGLGASVMLAGYTDDPGRIYQRAALSMLTSRYEGFALVLLESLSRGCPPVSYNVKYGPSELIDHGVNGVLVEDGDIAAMAEEVTRLLTDSLRRERMSDAALASAAGNSAEVVVARWSAVFNHLAAEAWRSA